MKTIEDKLFDPLLVLEDDKVKLRIVRLEDINKLKEIAFEPAIWTYFATEINTLTELTDFVKNAITDYEKKQRVTFVIIDKEKNSIAGMSSFGNISLRDKRIEIGWSWLGLSSQGTGINKSYKNLMLKFAFEELGFIRVEFKTDVLNLKARKALIKVGTTEEGILRSHTLMPHNRRRDTIYYSILNNEWEAYKQKI